MIFDFDAYQYSKTGFMKKIRLFWIRVMLLIQLKVSLCDKLVLFIPIGTFNSQVRNILFI